jgi:hypothetical protein
MNLMSSIHSHPTLFGTGAAIAVMTAGAAAFLIPVSATAERGISPHWAESYSVITSPADESDALPQHLVTGEQALTAIDHESTRTLGTDTEGIRYWAAFNSADELCLIAALPGDLQFTGMGCASADNLKKRALRLQVADAGTAVNAYLIPDSFVGTAVRTNDAHVAENLVIEHPYRTGVHSSATASLTNEEGQILELTPFGEIDRSFGAGTE